MQLVHEKAVSQKCYIKEMSRKTSQNLQINKVSTHLEVFCQKKRCSEKFCKIQRKAFSGVSYLIKLQAGNLELSRKALKMLCKTGYSQKFSKFHRKKTLLESLFNKVAVLRASNFIKEDFDAGVFFRNLRTIILKNICERLLLNFT